MSEQNRSISVSLLFLLCFLFYNNCNGQIAVNRDNKKFIIEAGANFSNMNFNKGVPAPTSPIQSSWMAGISAGVMLEVPLTNKLFIEPGYFFISRNGEDKSTGIKYSNDYFSFPVLLKYKLNSFVELLAGPQAGLLIESNSFYNGIKTNITHDVEERSIAGTAGFNIYISKTVFISARYLQGFNHIGIGQRTDPKEFKYEEGSLLIGYLF